MVTSAVDLRAVGFLVVVPPVWFQSLADGWLGNAVVHQWLGVAGPVNPLYISIFLLYRDVSVGEALYSPRLYEYAAAVAPKGQEASYMALSMLPIFVAKLLVGSSSGWLLAAIAGGGPAPFRSHVVIIGGMALVTPVGTYLFRKQIQVHEEGRDDSAAEKKPAGENTGTRWSAATTWRSGELAFAAIGKHDWKPPPRVDIYMNPCLKPASLQFVGDNHVRWRRAPWPIFPGATISGWRAIPAWRKPCGTRWRKTA